MAGVDAEDVGLELEGFVDVVGDGDGGDLAVEEKFAHPGEKIVAGGAVEAGEGFVEQDEAGGGCGEGAGERDALAFAAGEIAGEAAGEGVKAEEGEGVVDEVGVLGWGGAGVVGETDVAAHGEMGKEG